LSQSLQLQLRPQYSRLAAGREATCNVLLEISPLVTSAKRLPLNICVLLDASGTMRRFELTPEEVAHWEQVAESRGELVARRVDREEGVVFTGETLRELQASARKPLDLAVTAIKRVSGRLVEGDRLSLVAFATRAAVAYDGSDALDKGKLFEALNRLQADPAALRVGDGTRAAEAVRIALEMLTKQSAAAAIGRLVILTDGIVQDRPATLAGLETARRQQLSTTTVGIGSDFDEEFLARAADSSGGEYYFAAEPGAVAEHLSEEMAQIQSIVARGLQVSAAAANGARVLDLHQVRPRLRIFDEVDTTGGVTTVSVGDVLSGRKTALMLELALPACPAGDQELAEVSIRWLDPGATEPQVQAAQLALSFGDEAAPGDEEIADLAARLAVYKAEREAQWAQEDGDVTLATRKLRQATRILQDIGEAELAGEFEQQARDLESNQVVDSRRTKSLKQATRRLTRE